MPQISQSAKDILTDVINNTNKTRPNFKPYEYGQLFFQYVRPYDLSPEHYDTVVLISDDDSADFSNWIEIFYRRLPISMFINGDDLTMPYKAEYTDLYAMLPDINSKFGINFVKEDLLNFVPNFENVVDGTLNIQVTAAKEALLIRGGVGLTLIGCPTNE